MPIGTTKESGQTGIGHLLSNPAVKIGIGALTGGAGGALMATMPSNSPAGQMAALYRMGAGAGGSPEIANPADSINQVQDLQMPELGSQLNPDPAQTPGFNQPELGAMFRRAGRNPNLGVNYGG